MTNVKEFLKEYNELVKRHGMYVSSDGWEHLVCSDSEVEISIQWDAEKKEWKEGYAY